MNEDAMWSWLRYDCSQIDHLFYSYTYDYRSEIALSYFNNVNANKECDNLRRSFENQASSFLLWLNESKYQSDRVVSLKPHKTNLHATGPISTDIGTHMWILALYTTIRTSTRALQRNWRVDRLTVQGGAERG